jgi:hypothetical protein
MATKIVFPSQAIADSGAMRERVQSGLAERGHNGVIEA